MSIFRQIRSLLGKTEVAPPTTAETGNPAKPATPPAPVERRSRKRLNTHKGRRVLVIDDSPTVVAVLRKILRSAGCVALEAPDAEKGLELVRREKPDLVFLDIVLPGMSGFAALRLLRRDPLTQHIPVVMISGNEQATEQFYAKRIGADDFMKKPFSRFEVFARIDRLIEAGKLALLKGSAVEEQALAVPQAAPLSSAAGQRRRPEAGGSPALSALEARKQLTAMGLQYFNHEQFAAAIARWDKLALERFIVGGGVNVDAQVGGKTLLELAQEHGHGDLAALLRQRGEPGALA